MFVLVYTVKGEYHSRVFIGRDAKKRATRDYEILKEIQNNLGGEVHLIENTKTTLSLSHDGEEFIIGKGTK